MKDDNLQQLVKDSLEDEDTQRLSAEEDNLSVKQTASKPSFDPERKPNANGKFTDEEKWEFLDYWDDVKLPKAPSWVAGFYRRFLDELCAKDDRPALIKKAYACYGHGNAVYGQDWEASMECLLRAMELKPETYIANTLGYMYYYGRTNGGVPEYDKAFYYFTIGAAGGACESRYKLADMFWHGYYVAKAPHIAAQIIRDLYNEQLKIFCWEWYGCEFADVALRLGNVFRDGYDGEPNPDRAYYYYLQARCALKERREHGNDYGDDKVAAGIDRAIREILPQTDYASPRQTVRVDVGELLRQSLKVRPRMAMTVREGADGKLKLTFRLVPFAYEKGQPRLFLTIPEAGYCGRKTHLTVTVDGIRTEWHDRDRFEFDEIRWDGFYLYGQPMFAIDTKGTVHVPKPAGKEYRFVSVTFAPGGATYDYRCDDESVCVGDTVMVPTARGEVPVYVEAVYTAREGEMSMPIRKYKSVLGKEEPIAEE